jgi:hypothetical protein
MQGELKLTALQRVSKLELSIQYEQCAFSF